MNKFRDKIWVQLRKQFVHQFLDEIWYQLIDEIWDQLRYPLLDQFMQFRNEFYE